jgi:hypothetical protein
LLRIKMKFDVNSRVVLAKYNNSYSYYTRIIGFKTVH